MAESNSNVNKNVIDFREKTAQQKLQLIYEIITKLTNFDPVRSTCDWSTSTMSLHVPNAMVINLVQHLNFQMICSKLIGVKTLNEVLDIVFNPYEE